LHVLPQDGESGAEVGGDFFALPRQLEIGFEVRELPPELRVFANQPFEARSLGKSLFGRLPVLPKIRLRYLFLEDFKLAALLGDVKENSAGRSRGP